MIPLDLNETFGNFRMGGNAQQMIDLDVYRPSAGSKALIDRLLSIGKYKAQYIQYVTNLVETHFSVQAIHQQIDHLYSLIRDAVVADKHKLYSTELFEKSIRENVKLERRQVSPLRPDNRGEAGRQREKPRPPAEIIGLKPFVTKRIESIKAQLRGDRRGYIIKR